ncbi:hypothetical protein [Acetobacterium wieringae]|uniref:hypothetical protein n=1 Tax=Acetobacterium wieringae TaxID=52694 RepID=UPI003B84B535
MMPVQRFPQLLNVIQQRFIAAAIGNRCDCGVFALDRAFFLTLPPDIILGGKRITVICDFLNDHNRIRDQSIVFILRIGHGNQWFLPGIGNHAGH